MELERLRIEHPTLTVQTVGAIDALRSWESQVVPAGGGSVWAHHLEFAERIKALGDHLRPRVGHPPSEPDWQPSSLPRRSRHRYWRRPARRRRHGPVSSAARGLARNDGDRIVAQISSTTSECHAPETNPSSRQKTGERDARREGAATVLHCTHPHELLRGGGRSACLRSEPISGDRGRRPRLRLLSSC